MTTLAAKQRAKQRQRRWRRTAILGAALVPPALLAGLAYSPLCDVDTVRVTGTHRLSVAGVTRVADVGHGPLVSVNVAAVERRLTALPGVKSATVTRSWPSTVTVHVVERVPVVAVPRGTRLDLYDVDAVRVASVTSAPDTMPVLAVSTGAPTPEVIDAAVALLRALPATMRDDVRGLRADGPASLSFHFADGSEVVWGSGDRTVEKVRALTLLVDQHAKRYDVTVPDHPAVVP